MATFSENQVRQFYVATGLKGLNTRLVSTDALGKIEVFPGDTPKEHIYFEYMSNDGIVRSDLINTKSIKKITHTTAANMKRKLKAVTLTPEAGFKPSLKEDYIVNVIYRNYIGLSDAHQEVKVGSVRATSKMTSDRGEWSELEKDTFLKALAEDLARNLANEVTPLVKVSVHSTATTSLHGFDENNLKEIKIIPGQKVDYDTVVDIDSIVITEVEQPWTIGKFAQEQVNFDVQIVPDENDEFWMTLANTDSKETLGNGKLIADMEYFYKGERGDIYRGMGYPNNFEYKGVAVASQEYDVIDIEYSYEGNAEDIQKSPKVISIAINNSDAVTLLGRIKAGAGIN